MLITDSLFILLSVLYVSHYRIPILIFCKKVCIFCIYYYRYFRYYLSLRWNGGRGGAIQSTPDEQFIQKHTSHFLNKFGNIHDDHSKYNINVELLYYDSVKFQELLLVDDSYEKMWKTRCILVYTPYGNVSMYYNIFSRGFTYFADTKNIPYTILNCVCMVYVMRYFCLDFYIDNIVIPDWISPHWIAWEKKPLVESTVAAAVPYIPRIEIEKKPNTKIFAKLKNYRLDHGRDEDGNKNKIFNKNKFIYGGKLIDMSSFSFTKIQKKSVCVNLSKLSYQEFISKKKGAVEGVAAAAQLDDNIMRIFS